jgi:hypothetical protein
MNASSSDDWERIEGYVAVSAMVGGGQHAQPERMLKRQVSVDRTHVHTSLVGRLWRISARCVLSNCLTLGVHSTGVRTMVRVRSNVGKCFRMSSALHVGA